MDQTANEEREKVRQICDALVNGGVVAHESAAAPSLAQQWIAAGFDDAEEVGDWLRARCFTPEGALALERAGITPAQASLRTTQGTQSYEETIGYKIINGDLSLDEARRIITSDFWNA